MVKEVKILQAEEAKNGEKVYRRLHDIPGYSAEAIQNKQFFYVKFVNYYGEKQDGYARCTKEDFYNFRNNNRNEERRENSREEHTHSIKKYAVNGEDSHSVFADKSNRSPYDVLIIGEFIEKVYEIAKDKIDKLIIKCLLEDPYITDKEIASVTGKARSTIQERRQKITDKCNECLPEYKDYLFEKLRN